MRTNIFAFRKNGVPNSTQTAQSARFDQGSRPISQQRIVPSLRNAEAATQAGLTLIEAMAALAIFAIGSLGILSIFLSSFAMTNQNQNLTSGYEIAQSAMGVLRANGAQALSLDGATASATSPAGNSLLNPVSAVMSAYGMPPQSKVALAVTSLNGNGLCPCTATVTVTWGGAQTYTTQSIVGY